MPDVAIFFARLQRTDFDRLAGWLAEAEVAHWWNHETTPAAIEHDFGSSIDGSDPAEVFVVSIDGRPAGIIQRYLVNDEPEYRAELRAVCEIEPGTLSIDYFIGDPALRGRGLGSAMVEAFVADSWIRYPDAPAVVVPVAAANEASWRTLERAGFERIAVGEMTPDNPIDGRAHVIYRITRATDGRNGPVDARSS